MDHLIRAAAQADPNELSYVVQHSMSRDIKHDNEAPMPSSRTATINIRRYRRRLKIFIQILMKILLQMKHCDLYCRAKTLLRISAQANERRMEDGEDGYGMSSYVSHCERLQDQLEILVGEEIWRKAVKYLSMHLVRNVDDLRLKRWIYHQVLRNI
mmetsp:Transcript_18717/g.27333  ORF Transcript_18717/g.27333 Transcript_18717/m.27333 type:complete len:156 (+) Transcript_18717:79-546(+)